MSGGLWVPALTDRTYDLVAIDPYLAPGETRDYHQVRDDLSALVVDNCGLAPFPAPAETS